MTNTNIVDDLVVAVRRARGLRRFVAAQDSLYPTGLGTNYSHAMLELAKGRKTGHWMWFIFPQAQGLGSSVQSRVYGLSRSEARRYLGHPVLGGRLRRAILLVLKQVRRGWSLTELFGEEDARKFASCLDLFAEVEPAEFAAVKERLVQIAWPLALTQPDDYRNDKTEGKVA